jgi:hypothetical protein
LSGSWNAASITLDHEAYAQRRPAERSRMIAIRRERKIHVGDMLSFAFENTATLTYQVQEMVFTERLADAADVAHELDVYGPMLPDSHSLVATMFVELTDPETVRDELARLDGLQRAVRLEIGGANPYYVTAEEIAGPDEDSAQPGPLVSVHVFRFRFNAAARDAFRDPAQPVELVVDHPEYADAAPITGALRTALIADLAL